MLFQPRMLEPSKPRPSLKRSSLYWLAGAVKHRRAGITRQRVIGLLRAAGETVHEVTLSVDDFRAADEIFSTGNISKVVPVIGFDAKTFEFGPAARRARALYWDWAHS